MQESEKNRLRELASEIATEQDHDKFSSLVEELNRLLDGEKPPLNEPHKPAANA
jgi:hypothetical protein